MPRVNIQPNTPEWHKWRSSGIGASDVPIILGCSPYADNTPFRLWQKKIGAIESSYTSSQRAGHALEPLEREKAENHFGFPLPEECWQHDYFEWARASLDGFSCEHNQIIEIKLTNAERFAWIEANGVPEDWLYQCNFQMWVTDCPNNLLMVNNNGKRLQIEVPYQPSLIEDAMTKLLEFYDCLKTLTPPGYSEHDHVLLESETALAKEENILFWYKKFKEADVQLKYWKKLLEEETDDGNCEGKYFKLTRINRNGNVDWQKLCLDRNISKEEQEKYRKAQSGYYKYTLKDEE